MNVYGSPSRKFFCFSISFDEHQKRLRKPDSGKMLVSLMHRSIFWFTIPRARFFRESPGVGHDPEDKWGVRGDGKLELNGA